LQTWRTLDPLHRSIHFWRDRSGREVDFILEQAGKLVALEIKAGSMVTASDAAGIRAFREALRKKSALVRSAVLHAGQARPLDTALRALPWGWLSLKTSIVESLNGQSEKVCASRANIRRLRETRR